MYIQLTLHVGDQGLPIKVLDWIILYNYINPGCGTLEDLLRKP